MELLNSFSDDFGNSYAESAINGVTYYARHSEEYCGTEMYSISIAFENITISYVIQGSYLFTSYFSGYESLSNIYYKDTTLNKFLDFYAPENEEFTYYQNMLKILLNMLNANSFYV
jgi:hypothetical protein